MATYNQIQSWVKENYGLVVKTCWVAHVKEQCGLALRKAPNRIDPLKRVHPCPRDKIEPIKQALRNFNMI